MEEKEDVIILTDEEGAEQEFRHIDTVEYKNAYYVALAPAVYDDSADDEEYEEVFILKLTEENGEDILSVIEDDDELNEVFEQFQKQADEQEEE